MGNWYRKSSIKVTGKIGTVYLLHITPPYQHCGHYVGFTERRVETRVGEHWRGNGAALTGAAIEAGHTLILTRTWENVDQSVEFLIKCRAENPKLCPICNPDTAHNLAQYDREV